MNLIKMNFFKQTEQIQMQCKGCAAKVPFDALKKSLPENITLSSYDAAPVPHYPKLFQTIDMINGYYFRSLFTWKNCSKPFIK